MKIFYWSPFLSNIATVDAVLKSINSLLKFDKQKMFDPQIIDAVGEWNQISTRVEKIKIKRLYKKEKPWQPHKSHFYQKAIMNGYSHSEVCIIIAKHGLLLIIISFLASIMPSLIIILFSILISSLSTIYLLYYLNKKPLKVK